MAVFGACAIDVIGQTGQRAAVLAASSLKPDAAGEAANLPSLNDRFLDHALVYALIEIADRDARTLKGALEPRTARRPCVSSRSTRWKVADSIDARPPALFHAAHRA